MPIETQYCTANATYTNIEVDNTCYWDGTLWSAYRALDQVGEFGSDSATLIVGDTTTSGEHTITLQGNYNQAVAFVQITDASCQDQSSCYGYDVRLTKVESTSIKFRLQVQPTCPAMALTSCLPGSHWNWNWNIR